MIIMKQIKIYGTNATLFSDGQKLQVRLSSVEGRTVAILEEIN